MVFAECLLLRTAVGLQPLQQGLSATTLIYPDSFQTTSLQRSNCILSPPLVRKLSRASKVDTGSNLQKRRPTFAGTGDAPLSEAATGCVENILRLAKSWERNSFFCQRSSIL